MTPPRFTVMRGRNRLASLAVQCRAVVAHAVVVRAGPALVGGDITARRTGAVVMVDAVGGGLFLIVDGI